MKIGMVGLGKLGAPVAAAIRNKGHHVTGYDIDGTARRMAVAQYGLTVVNDLFSLVEASSLIFVAVQTPHEPEYEGVTPLPATRKDFDYAVLRACVERLAGEIDTQGQRKVVSIISTVLPGTIDREIVPLLNDKVALVYNPSFIAMGSVEDDFVDPEFVLLGVRDEDAETMVSAFFKTITTAEQVRVSIPNAELIKMTYNTFISWKIVFANALMELCHKIPGTDIDVVTGALKHATKRILSPMYMGGGMGDGGGCHPRDNIALSWLAQENHLSYDIFEKVMEAREKQTDWLARLMIFYATGKKLPMVILGQAFKSGVTSTLGSPAVLLKNLLTARGYDIKTCEAPPLEHKASVFLIGTKHPYWPDTTFPPGSVIIDPWRYMPEKPDCKVIPVGRG